MRPRFGGAVGALLRGIGRSTTTGRLRRALSYRRADGEPERAIGRRLVVGLVAALLTAATAPAAADPDADFAKAKKCTSCHALDERRVGPPFKAVAAKYENDPTAATRLARKIRDGGGGVWGVLVMPQNDVTPAEAERLAGWVLRQR